MRWIKYVLSRSNVRLVSKMCFLVNKWCWIQLYKARVDLECEWSKWSNFSDVINVTRFNCGFEQDRVFSALLVNVNIFGKKYLWWRRVVLKVFRVCSYSWINSRALLKVIDDKTICVKVPHPSMLNIQAGLLRCNMVTTLHSSVCIK